jgi:hypothetical protein
VRRSHGDAQTFKDAKAAAERAFDKLSGFFFDLVKHSAIDCSLDQHPDRLAAIRRICLLPPPADRASLTA